MIYEKITDLIGNTPVVKYATINGNDIYLKLEMFNPAGSIKDRVAYQMVKELIDAGKINKDTKIVEATSGNTGIGLALVLGCMGLHPYIFLPANMSKERIDLLKAYGAKVMLTDSKLGMSGAKDAAVEFSKNDNVIYVDQFANVANVKAHELTTALEIISDFKDLDYLIAGVGTSGTITGLSHKLKSHYKDLKVIGIEPNESAILSCGTKGSHGIQGIGAGFIPPLYEKEIVDEIIRVSTNSANEKAKELALQGLFLGISSAAAICGALEICQRVTNKSILVICPDGGQKYMSLGVYNNE